MGCLTLHETNCHAMSGDCRFDNVTFKGMSGHCALTFRTSTRHFTDNSMSIDGGDGSLLPTPSYAMMPIVHHEQPRPLCQI